MDCCMSKTMGGQMISPNDFGSQMMMPQGFGGQMTPGFGYPMIQQDCGNQIPPSFGGQMAPQGPWNSFQGQVPMPPSMPGCGAKNNDRVLVHKSKNGKNESLRCDGTPAQARVRKAGPPSQLVPKRKVGEGSKNYTTLAAPLASPPQVGGTESPEMEAPDHEKFDTLTLAFGTKPGTDKPAKMLVTLKTPKVLDAQLNTSTASTQVDYGDLGLPGPNPPPPAQIVVKEKSPPSKKSKASQKSKNSTKKRGKNKK